MSWSAVAFSDKDWPAELSWVELRRMMWPDDDALWHLNCLRFESVSHLDLTFIAPSFRDALQLDEAALDSTQSCKVLCCQARLLVSMMSGGFWRWCWDSSFSIRIELLDSQPVNQPFDHTAWWWGRVARGIRFGGCWDKLKHGHCCCCFGLFPDTLWNEIGAVGWLSL